MIQINRTLIKGLFTFWATRPPKAQRIGLVGWDSTLQSDSLTRIKPRVASFRDPLFTHYATLSYNHEIGNNFIAIFSLKEIAPYFFVCFPNVLVNNYIADGPQDRASDNFMKQRGETMTSVSAGHIILTPTQPVRSGWPQRGSNPGSPGPGVARSTD